MNVVYNSFFGNKSFTTNSSKAYIALHTKNMITTPIFSRKSLESKRKKEELKGI